MGVCKSDKKSDDSTWEWRHPHAPLSRRIFTCLSDLHHSHTECLLLAAPGGSWRARAWGSRPGAAQEPPPGNTFSSAREHLQLRPGTPSGLLRSLKVCNCRQFWPSEAQICATVDNSSPRKLKSEQLSSIIALGCSNVRNCRQYCSWVSNLGARTQGSAAVAVASK